MATVGTILLQAPLNLLVSPLPLLLTAQCPLRKQPLLLLRLQLLPPLLCQTMVNWLSILPIDVVSLKLMRERIASQFATTIQTAKLESFAGLLMRIIAAAFRREPTLIQLNPPSTADVARANWQQEHSAASHAAGNAASLVNHALLFTKTTATQITSRRALLKLLKLQPHLALLLKQQQEPQLRLTTLAQQPLLALQLQPLLAPASKQLSSQRQPPSRSLPHQVQPQQLRQFSKIAKMELTTTSSCIKLHPCNGSPLLYTATMIF